MHGRLGDLGTIDEQYDVAVSTACAALDHIVVDSMDTAVQCVSYLKRSGVGCATFIGLDKVEHLRANASKKMTTYVRREGTWTTHHPYVSATLVTTCLLRPPFTVSGSYL